MSAPSSVTSIPLLKVDKESKLEVPLTERIEFAFILSLNTATLFAVYKPWKLEVVFALKPPLTVISAAIVS